MLSQWGVEEVCARSNCAQRARPTHKTWLDVPGSLKRRFFDGVDMTFPSDLVAEAADLLDRPARELEPDDIMKALRIGHPGRNGDVDAGEVNMERLSRAAELYEPIHNAIEESSRSRRPAER